MESTVDPFWPRMRLQCRNALLFAAALCAFGVTPARAAEEVTAEQVRAKIETLAGAPVASVSFYRIHYWTALDERALILWLGREEPYFITLRDRCHGIARDSILRLSDYQRPGRNRLRVRWSIIFTRDGRTCRIGGIQPLDLEGMRALAAPYALPGEEDDATADR